jgi:hypothetical protein
LNKQNANTISVAPSGEIDMKTIRLTQLLVVLFAGMWLVAQLAVPVRSKADPASESSVPLESLLGPDGTLDLNTGFTGSLDVSGWKLVAGPSGQPRFVRTNTSQSHDDTRSSLAQNQASAPTAAGDEKWDDQFGLAGTGCCVTQSPSPVLMCTLAAVSSRLEVGA